MSKVAAPALSHSLPLNQVVEGDAETVLRTLPDGVVQCVVTSPPYFGLRDYQSEGQIGLEPSPQEYTDRLVSVFAEVWRVLHDDGVAWLNLGDSHNAAGRVGQDSRTGCKPKDLLGIPWLVAFALREWGWYLRQRVVWAKGLSFCEGWSGAILPESVQDRPTTSHEEVFMLTKRADYFYAAWDGREGAKDWGSRDRSGWKARSTPGQTPQSGAENLDFSARGRNLRSVWAIGTKPYKGAHFATFPTALVEPMIRLGTPRLGVCAKCWTPWTRTYSKASKGWKGWQPQCSCDTEGVRPATVLDPFAGSGTAGVVSLRMDRDFIGIDIAGGDKDLGGHTANSRLQAVMAGRPDPAGQAVSKPGKARRTLFNLEPG